MTPREKIQAAYELAFFPPRIHTLWNQLKQGELKDREVWAELVDMAISLHLALPQRGYSSPGALHRLAFYQAQSRGFAMPLCLYNIRKRMMIPGEPPTGSVPPHLVRDIGLPEFCRERKTPNVNQPVSPAAEVTKHA
ncbi:MAG TPA: hypothetical protein PKE55_04515 [Kiritimatiellia bacterium]|nr:hypothetical protein [Kiritimatiellia bacterium]